jgi:REP element-mobilizing transposase RayT
LSWLEKQKIIDLEAAVVMPDHVHFIARLRTGTLSGLMHSLKSFTST